MLAWAIPETFGENSALSFVLNAIFIKGFLDNIWLIIQTPVFLIVLIVLGEKFEVIVRWKIWGNEMMELAQWIICLKRKQKPRLLFFVVVGFGGFWFWFFLSSFWYSCCVHMENISSFFVLSHVILCMLCIILIFFTKNSVCSSISSPPSWLDVFENCYSVFLL